jgi:hypothetical protein
LLCEDCQEIATIGTCPECNTFLCKNDSCCDPSYKCTSCEDAVCLPCVEKDGYGAEVCDCDAWYCSSCVHNNLSPETCCVCSRQYSTCRKCSSFNQLEKCQGDCDMPLCDDCVCSLACGNDARLCGKCDFECEDCDMCQGYYSSSRWK